MTKKPKIDESKYSVYKPVFDTKRFDYLRKVSTDEGVECEVFSFYMADSHMVCNPPDRTKLIDKLTKILKGTGISKITITFLSDNL